MCLHPLRSLLFKTIMNIYELHDNILTYLKQMIEF